MLPRRYPRLRQPFGACYDIDDLVTARYELQLATIHVDSTTSKQVGWWLQVGTRKYAW